MPGRTVILDLAEESSQGQPTTWWAEVYRYLATHDEFSRWGHQTLLGRRLLLTADGDAIAVPPEGGTVVCFAPSGEAATLDVPGRFRSVFVLLNDTAIQGGDHHTQAVRDWLMRVLDVCIDFGAAGPLTLQFFKTADGCVLSEINPRFGGGFPLALAAGADYPEWLMQIVEGRHLRPRIGEYRAGLYMTRSYHETIVSAPFPHGRADD